MCEHEDGNEYEEETVEVIAVGPPNGADIALAVLSPLEGFVAGVQNMMVRFHGLLVLQSQFLDERKERKRAAQEMERALGMR